MTTYWHLLRGGKNNPCKQSVSHANLWFALPSSFVLQTTTNQKVAHILLLYRTTDSLLGKTAASWRPLAWPYKSCMPIQTSYAGANATCLSWHLFSWLMSAAMSSIQDLKMALQSRDSTERKRPVSMQASIFCVWWHSSLYWVLDTEFLIKYSSCSSWHSSLYWVLDTEFLIKYSSCSSWHCRSPYIQRI